MFISEMFVRVCYRWNGFCKEHQGNTIYVLPKLVFLSYVAVYMLHGVLHVLLKLYVAIPED